MRITFGDDNRFDNAPVDPNFRWYGPRTDYERNPAKADEERQNMTPEQINALRKKMGLPPLAA